MTKDAKDGFYKANADYEQKILSIIFLNNNLNYGLCNIQNR